MEHEMFMLLLNAIGERGVLVLLAVMLGLGALYVVARVYVAMTPSHDDDEALDRGASAFAGLFRAAVGFVLGRRQPPAGGAAALLLASLLSLSGCVSDADRALLDRGVAHNMRVAGDESLPPVAREVALDNADAFALLRYSLTGDELPPETRARLEAHRAAVASTDSSTR